MLEWRLGGELPKREEGLPASVGVPVVEKVFRISHPPV